MSGSTDKPRTNPWYNSWTYRTASRIASTIPRVLSQAGARFIGHLAHDLCDQQRDIMRENLRVVTGKNGPELDTIVRNGFVHFIQMIADNLRIQTSDLSEVADIVGEWSGLEHLREAQARGKGTVLITGHLGAWELGGILLAVRDIPVTVVTLAEPRADLGEWREKYRQKFGISTITLGEDRFAFLSIVQTLRKNGIVALLVDRPYGEHSQPVEMFGRTAHFSPAASLLWQHTGATILPAFVFAQPSGKYASHAYAPIEMSTAQDPSQTHHVNTQRIADFFASLLQIYPDQWYNFVPVWTDRQLDHGPGFR